MFYRVCDFGTWYFGTFCRFLFSHRKGRERKKMIYNSISIYIIKFIYIIIYINSYNLFLHFSKQQKVPKYQVPKYHFAVFVLSPFHAFLISCKIRAKIGGKKGGFYYFYLQDMRIFRTFALSMRMNDKAPSAAENIFQVHQIFLPAQSVKIERTKSTM